MENHQLKDDKKRTLAPADNTDDADKYLKWME